MYRTLLPAKGLPLISVTPAGICTASAAMYWKASASMAVKSVGRKKVGAGRPVMTAAPGLTVSEYDPPV